MRDKAESTRRRIAEVRKRLDEFWWLVSEMEARIAIEKARNESREES